MKKVLRENVDGHREVRAVRGQRLERVVVDEPDPLKLDGGGGVAGRRIAPHCDQGAAAAGHVQVAQPRAPRRDRRDAPPAHARAERHVQPRQPRAPRGDGGEPGVAHARARQREPRERGAACQRIAEASEIRSYSLIHRR